ncbi:hypothetical protein Q4598_17780 [Phaeobacter inhibens]|uniref:hypothetical protein n=1 Tax=Phaeobacter inhibens TaxID=221822 RepID=UPI0026E3BFB1|nr:hypothetical protein [Phaeobacter inhibens]MDO6758093.1 hypothetical protein [Phaeobacter inhibens]
MLREIAPKIISAGEKFPIAWPGYLNSRSVRGLDQGLARHLLQAAKGFGDCSSVDPRRSLALGLAVKVLDLHERRHVLNVRNDCNDKQILQCPYPEKGGGGPAFASSAYDDQARTTVEATLGLNQPKRETRRLLVGRMLPVLGAGYCQPSKMPQYILVSY